MIPAGHHRGIWIVTRNVAGEIDFANHISGKFERLTFHVCGAVQGGALNEAT